MVLRPVLSPSAASLAEQQPRPSRSAATALVFSPVGGGAQPYSSQAVALCVSNCSPMCLRLQPYVSQATALCAQAVSLCDRRRRAAQRLRRLRRPLGCGGGRGRIHATGVTTNPILYRPNPNPNLSTLTLSTPLHCSCSAGAPAAARTCSPAAASAARKCSPSACKASTGTRATPVKKGCLDTNAAVARWSSAACLQGSES